MKYSTEDRIADTFLEALDDLSDQHLEALREAFDSGPITDPRNLIKQLFRGVLDQARYRAQGGYG